MYCEKNQVNVDTDSYLNSMLKITYILTSVKISIFENRFFIRIVNLI